MVSERCKMAVNDVFKKQGLHLTKIELGVVEILEPVSEDVTLKLKKTLQTHGFVLIEDKRAVLIERIKNIIIEMVHHSDNSIKMNFSDYLSQNLHHNYTYLANMFSETQGISIEQFIISHKIERVKELILYDELNITEIAFKMNYSSVAHLSGQFKKYTGLTPSYFRKLKLRRLEPIEEIGSLKVS
jgi:AraC-like DNA-binding protein